MVHRVAVLSDVHGVLPVLEAVLAEPAVAEAVEREAAVLAVAAAAGVEGEDMPGLHGLCVEAIRSAERHGR